MVRPRHPQLGLREPGRTVTFELIQTDPAQ